MKALAQIKFVTGPVSDTTLVNGIPYSTLKADTPNEVAGFFAADRATDEYNYTTTREDIAMTFEEVMMVAQPQLAARRRDHRQGHGDVDQQHADRALGPARTRRRRHDQAARAVRRRPARAVGAAGRPAAVTALPAPIAMRPGESWTANLVLPAPPSGMARAQALLGPRLSPNRIRSCCAARRQPPADRHRGTGDAALDTERALRSSALSSADRDASDRHRSAAVRPAVCNAARRLPHNRANFSRAPAMTLIAFVALYLLASVAIGLYAATRVKNTADYAVAGRSLPLIMIVTTTFATWFGSETVLGIPSKFVEGGLQKTVEDPFGAAFCLIFVGMFFARKLYNMNLLTIGDFYRQRYGKGVEIFSAAVILISYLGWVAAQITALGLVFHHALRRRDLDRAGHGARHRHRVRLHGVRRHVVGGADRLPADDHHRRRAVADRVVRGRSRRRRRQGRRLRRRQGHVQVLPGADDCMRGSSGSAPRSRS